MSRQPSITSSSYDSYHRQAKDATNTCRTHTYGWMRVNEWMDGYIYICVCVCVCSWRPTPRPIHSMPIAQWCSMSAVGPMDRTAHTPSIHRHTHTHEGVCVCVCLGESIDCVEVTEGDIRKVCVCVCVCVCIGVACVVLTYCKPALSLRVDVCRCRCITGRSLLSRESRHTAM